MFFSPFSIEITSLGEERAILVLFIHLFNLCLFGFVGFLSFPLGVWEGLRFVIVALPGLLSYPLFKALLRPANFTLGPDVTLNTEKNI